MGIFVGFAVVILCSTLWSPFGLVLAGAVLGALLAIGCDAIRRRGALNDWRARAAASVPINVVAALVVGVGYKWTLDSEQYAPVTHAELSRTIATYALCYSGMVAAAIAWVVVHRVRQRQA